VLRAAADAAAAAAAAATAAACCCVLLLLLPACLRYTACSADEPYRPSTRTRAGRGERVAPHQSLIVHACHLDSLIRKYIVPVTRHFRDGPAPRYRAAAAHRIAANSATESQRQQVCVLVATLSIDIRPRGLAWARTSYLVLVAKVLPPRPYHRATAVQQLAAYCVLRVISSPSAAARSTILRAKRRLRAP
jgi:hypothetical protein